MFRTLSTHVQRADFRGIQLVAPQKWRRPSDKIDSRVWILTSVCFLMGALTDLFSAQPLTAPADVMISLACLLPPVAIGIYQVRDRPVWWSGVALFWCAQILLLYRTGGIASPLFGGQMLFLFLVLVSVFVKVHLKHLVSVVGLHVVGWALFSYALKIEVPAGLSTQQIIIQNSLVLLCAYCIVLTLARATELYANEYERQTRRLTETQNHLCHAEKMAEIGKLVATTAHELAQPVQVIVTASSLMRKASHESTDMSQVRQLSERMTEASDRLQRLLAQLRDFSRKEPFVLKDIDLTDAIRSVHMLSQYDLRWSGIGCEMNISPEPLWTHGDSMRIQQVLFNLINNARDACHRTPSPVVRVTAAHYREWVRVSVWNNGEAIPAGLQAKLFEPYFTTKEPGRGTGLGLTICQQLIEQQGGRILFSSQDGDTTFVIDLPKTRGTSAPLNDTADTAAALPASAI